MTTRPPRKVYVKHHLSNIYKKYRKEVPANIQTTKEKMLAVLDLYIKKAKNEIIYNSAEIPFFGMLGSFRIRKRGKSKVLLTYATDGSNLAIDWAASKKAGKRIFHLNENRNGYRYKIHWRKGRLKNISNYCFIPCRNFKREVAKVLKTDLSRDYYE